MRTSLCAKKIFSFSLFVLILRTAAFSSSMQAREVLRYVHAVTGRKLDADIDYGGPVNRAFAFFFASTEWNRDGSPSRVIDRLIPSFAGIFDGVQAYNSSSDEGLWIKNISLKTENPFAVKRPAELDEASREVRGLASSTPLETCTPEMENSCESDGIFSFDEKKSASERRLEDSEKHLRLHFYDSEILSLQKKDDESVVVVSDGRIMSRKFYDSSMRLSKKENWTHGKSVSDMNLSSTEFFEYSPDGEKPVLKTVEEKNSRGRFVYDSLGRVSEIQIFSIEDEKSEGKNASEKAFTRLVSMTEFSYTDEGRIAEKRFTEYEHSSRGGEKNVRTFTRRDVYDYRDAENPPDYYYYEEGRLRLKTLYSSREAWTSTMYFDGGHTVVSYWKDGVRFRDDYYMDGILRRRRNYGAD